MIYFYCFACFIPSIIMLFIMFYNKNFDELSLCFILFVFGFIFSLKIYLAYFSPASLEKLEKIITNKTNK